MTESAASPLGVLRLGWRFFRRELRSPQFLVIGLAVMVAVTAITAVGSFTSRVRLALDEQSHSLLACDLAVFSSEPLEPALDSLATSLGVQSTRYSAMRTMLSAGERLQLAELKAVAPGYPLRGQLIVRDRVDGPDLTADAVPPPGEAWVEPRLLAMLGVTQGAEIQVGAAKLRLTRLLVLEPDRAGEFFAIAPRVLINLASLPATQLIAPGSRVQQALLLAGPREALTRFRREATLDNHARYAAPSDARPEIRAALTHAEQFLGLAALTATTLAGIAILLAARSYAEERQDTVALLRTFGAGRGQIVGLLLGEVLLLALLAGMLGTAAGLGLQSVIAGLLRDLTASALPPPPLASAARGLLAGVTAVAGFGLAPLLALRRVPPARILRQDLAAPGTRPLLAFSYALAALLLLAPWDSGDWRLTGWALAGFAGALLALGVTGLGLVTLLGRLRSRTGLAWRAGLASLARRPAQSVWQIAALGLGIMALLLLGLLRTDLLERWRETLPASTPDQFLFNIQPAQVDAVREFLRAHQLPAPDLHPMVRGRLLAIGGRTVGPDDYEDPRAKRLVDREFNLSWTAMLRPDNRVLSGQFWDRASTTPQFSVEVELARRLGIRLGDRLRFSVADREVEAEVTSLREVAWDSMKVNFFVVAPEALLGDLPSTYITSFRLPAGGGGVLRDLLAAFPNVTLVDVGAVLVQVRGIMSKVIAAVQFVFVFTLAAGVIVLISALQATQRERRYDAVLMKVLGAPRGFIARMLAVEFAALGLCAGLVGGLGAWAGGWLIAQRVLHIAYEFQPLTVAVGVMAGLVAITGLGVYAVTGALRVPVNTALRRL